MATRADPTSAPGPASGAGTGPAPGGPAAHADTTASAARPRTADGLWFGKNLSQAEPVPQAAIDAAVALMQSGRLHRYGEQGGAVPEPALLEQEYAAYLGSRYCVALNSCGSAMFIALKAVGVKAGDVVLTNSFTLSPVPGAIVHAGARPVLVEVLPNLTVDLADLERKITASGATTFLISHMRGHIADMGAVRALCDAHGVGLVEDCAHTMGARWDGRATGTFGRVGCFSAQTYKHINSGEGGLLVTDDDDIAAQAILMSGSYMMYDQHLSRPPAAVFERWKYLMPNFSMRMSNLAAALLRPQLALLPERAATWNRIHDELALALGRAEGVSVVARDPREEFVASSIQFALALKPAQVDRFVRECERRGLHLKWFGREEPLAFTSNFSHWRYLQDAPALPDSMAVMSQLLDLRTPLSLTSADCALIGRIVEVAAKIAASDA